jgi:hypothetical protein
MNQTNRIRGLALAGGILWAGAVNATSICEIDLLIAPLDFTNTGVCGQVDTELGGVLVQDIDESASVASASAQQGANPPAAGSDGTSGTATANYPNPDGTGGSVGAASFVSGGGGTLGMTSSTSSSFYIGEFIADDGLPGTNDLFDLTVNLGIDGELFVKNDGLAGLVLAFAAVDASGVELGAFGGVAALFNSGPISVFGTLPLGFTGGFTRSATCDDLFALPHECTITAKMTESIVLADLSDGDVFGLFLSIVTTAGVDGGVDDSEARADFANTVNFSFEGRKVMALPATVSVPEPASMALVLAGVLIVGLARRRRLY